MGVLVEIDLRPFLLNSPLSPPKLRKRRLRSSLLPIADDLLAAWDCVTVMGAGYGCAALYQTVMPVGDFGPEFTKIASAASLVGACIAPFTMRQRISSARERTDGTGHLVALAVAKAFWLMTIVLALGFLTRAVDLLPRLWMVGWFLSVATCAIIGRLALLGMLHRLEASGVLRQNIAVVGRTKLAAELIARLSASRSSTFDILGVFDDVAAPALPGAPSATGSLHDLVRLCKDGSVDRVILALDGADPNRVLDVVRDLKAVDTEVVLYLPQIGFGVSIVEVTRFVGLSLLLLVPQPIRQWGVIFKQVEDKLLGSLLLLAAIPAFVLIAAAIRLETPGPVLFRQRRHGWNNTEFDVLKFRTMTWEGQSQASGACQTSRSDRRVTRVGAFLRRTSLDELPQLLNVLSGEMSLVGPRPHPVVMRTESLLGSEIVAEYAHRHRVRPGMTGWAQVNGHRGATDTTEQIRKRVEFDIYYIENWSVFFDLKILLLTPLRLLLDRGNAF